MLLPLENEILCRMMGQGDSSGPLPLLRAAIPSLCSAEERPAEW